MILIQYKVYEASLYCTSHLGRGFFVVALYANESAFSMWERITRVLSMSGMFYWKSLR